QQPIPEELHDHAADGDEDDRRQHGQGAQDDPSLSHMVPHAFVNSSYTLRNRSRRWSTAWRLRESSVFTLTPVSAAISLKLRPSSSCATTPSRCSSGSSSSASSSSSRSTLRA